MTSKNVTASRISTLMDGRSAPVVRIDDNGITLDGEPLPLILAEDPIEVTVTDSAVVGIRLTLLSCGPTIIDRRTANERNTAIVVEDAPLTAPRPSERVSPIAVDPEGVATRDDHA